MFKFDKVFYKLWEAISNQRIVAIIPGAFRPPHKGHLELVEQYADIADIVKILISPDNPAARAKRVTPSGKYISADISKQIWDLYIRKAGLNNVQAEISKTPSPVGAAYEYVANENNDPQLAQPGELVILGVSTKGGDEARFQKSAQNYAREGVTVEVKPFIPRSDLSATDFRIAIDQGPEQILPFLPDGVKDKADNVLEIIQKSG